MVARHLPSTLVRGIHAALTSISRFCSLRPNAQFVSDSNDYRRYLPVTDVSLAGRGAAVTAIAPMVRYVGRLLG